MGKIMRIKIRRIFAYDNPQNFYPLAQKFLPNNSLPQMEVYLPLKQPEYRFYAVL
jgi:hypothetical protein